MFFEKADRIKGFSSAVFSEMEKAKYAAMERGIEVINLGIGSPDLPPAPHIRKRLQEAVADPNNYGYAILGFPELHEALADWYRNRFGVELDPKTEVLDLMGSQDGLAHISLAVINPGDTVLVPDPGYPIYSAGPLFAGAELYRYPLLEENNYLPVLEEFEPSLLKRAKMIIINYPNNPLAATAPLEFFSRLVELAYQYNFLICHDVAYCELAFDGYRPPSLLQVDGAKEVAVEFSSLSKTYNMAGCRLGFVSGNPQVIAALAEVKSYLDYGVFKPIQYAGITALTGPQEYVRETVLTYQRRRDVLVEGLNSIGWKLEKPKATMFVWAPVPGEYTSSDFATTLLAKTGVVVLPGNGFGENGEGYVRIGLVQDEEQLKEAVARIAESGLF